MTVLGVDACRAGWVGILLDDDRRDVRGVYGPTIDVLVAAASSDTEVSVVAIDMPIGLPDASIRRADLLGRELAGPRRSSVFTTPVRTAVEQDSYAHASALSRSLTGAGLSKQAFSLKRKLLEVDVWVRTTEHRAFEVHPEVSFAAIAGRHLPHAKKSWAGVADRRRLLSRAGLSIPDDLGTAGARAAVDDVLDAAAAAWTALRIQHGEAQSHPDPAEIFSDGLSSAIWV